MMKHISIVALFLLLLHRSIDATQYTPSFAFVTGKGDSYIYSWNYTQTAIAKYQAYAGDYLNEGLAGLLVGNDYNATGLPCDILLIGSTGRLYTIQHLHVPIPMQYHGGVLNCPGITNYSGYYFSYANVKTGIYIRIISNAGQNWYYLMPPLGGMTIQNQCTPESNLNYTNQSTQVVTPSTPIGVGTTNTFCGAVADNSSTYIIDSQMTTSTPGVLVLSWVYNTDGGNLQRAQYNLGITTTGPAPFTIAYINGMNTGWLVYGNTLYFVNLTSGIATSNKTITNLNYTNTNFAVLPVGYFPTCPDGEILATTSSSFDITTIAVVVLVIVVVVALYRRTRGGMHGGAHID